MSKSNPEQYNPENEASFPATIISTNMTTNEKGIHWALHIEAKDETVNMINHERSVADELFECV